jgi:hypothetical protein
MKNMNDYSLFAAGSGDEIQTCKEVKPSASSDATDAVNSEQSLADADPLFGANSGDEF